MRIYHFELPKLGHGLSGGEQCLVEVVRRLQARGIANTIVTTDNGRTTYERVGLHEDLFLRYATIDSFAFEQRHHVFTSYLQRTRLACRLMDTLTPEPGDVLLCNSDGFPNSIPFHRLARRCPQAKLVYWYRMQAPALFRGYEGHFTGRRRAPTPALVQYRLSQWLYRRLVLPRGVLLTHNPYYRDLLARLFPRHRVHQLQRYGGGLASPRPPAATRTTDLVWIGRFHAQKGLWQLIDIVKRLRAVKPDVSLVVIGADHEGRTADFERACADAGIAQNVRCVGELHGDAKFKHLLSAKLFLMTSYYESYGIVIVEAMSAGLPVVAYDLPVYGVFDRGVVKVPIRDNTAAAAAALRLLQDDAHRATLSRAAWDASREHTWDRVAEEILQVCQSA
jgi:glycosyltransferase involved in cell wall biosynthesis